jgi:hypothetical protein
VSALSSRPGADGYDDALGKVKPAKGERAALVPYLEPDETVSLRRLVEEVGEADGRVLQQGGVVILVTDRKFVAGHSSGGFRPRWDVFTLPYGHLEPGVEVRGERSTGSRSPTARPPPNWRSGWATPSAPTAAIEWGSTILSDAC